MQATIKDLELQIEREHEKVVSLTQQLNHVASENRELIEQATQDALKINTQAAVISAMDELLEEIAQALTGEHPMFDIDDISPDGIRNLLAKARGES